MTHSPNGRAFESSDRWRPGKRLYIQDVPGLISAAFTKSLTKVGLGLSWGPPTPQVELAMEGGPKKKKGPNQARRNNDINGFSSNRGNRS